MAGLSFEHGSGKSTGAENRAFKSQLNKVYGWYTGGFVTFVVGYYARDLNFTFFGWPFSVWMGGQGALIVYCVIIWYYARFMNKLDIEHDVHEED